METMYALYIMRRTQIYLDEAQGEQLAAAAAAAGTTVSALIRSAIDAYLDGPPSGEERLRRFRSAVSEAARAAPDLLPGDEYVEAIRPDYRIRERALRGGDETG
jgi:hypothetical protein